MITSSANHPMRGVSTYPFAIFRPGSLSAYVGEISTRGDTVIGNDVWTGHDVKIMPGVKIGDGAIIGAGAVVTGDVPPYAIMAGNPARLVRLRFSEAVVTALVSIAWWNWEHSRAEAALPGLSAAALAGDIATLQALAKQGTDKER